MVISYKNQLEKLEAAKAAWLVCLSFLSLTWSFLLLLGQFLLTGLYWAVLGSTGLCWAVLSCSGLYWAFLGSIWLCMTSDWELLYLPEVILYISIETHRVSQKTKLYPIGWEKYDACLPNRMILSCIFSALRWVANPAIEHAGNHHEVQHPICHDTTSFLLA